MSKLFCCYCSRYASEVKGLVEELRLRGISVWRDQDGGFQLGDNVQGEARRVIASPEETFGLLFYASPEALERHFIGRVELDEAIRRKQYNPDYLLFTVARRTNFQELAEQSRRQLGEDLSIYHSYAIKDTDEEGIQALPLRPQFIEIANKVLGFLLSQMRDRSGENGTLDLNFCTRDKLPPRVDDCLDLDATWLFRGGVARTETWPRLIRALRDIKRQVRTTMGLTTLRIGGSKHLTAAFLIGRMFPPPTVRDIQVQQGPALWSAACRPYTGQPLTTQVVDRSAGSEVLFVEITTTEKSVRDGVRRYTQDSGLCPFASLRIEPKDGRMRGAVTDNATACAMALQVRDAVARFVTERPAREIHLFAAIPQGLAALIGHHLNATLPIQLYEFDGLEYRPSCRMVSSEMQ